MTLRVSDHALLRYIERRFGVNVEGYREQIGTLCNAAHKAGARELKTDGLRFVIVDHTVVTVTPDKPRSPRRGQTVAA